MPRYIDADALIRLIEIDALCNFGNFSKRDVIGSIKALPTADVVPKSEVARLQEDVDRLQEINNRQVENIKFAEQRVAREIFEEIDKIFVDYKIDRCLEKRGLRLIVSNGEDIEQRFAELKKKYTEENV